MLTENDVAAVLTLQSTAYNLLMWLGESAVRDPYLLAPAAVELLRRDETAAAWLAARRSEIPGELLPQVVEGPFANLFASFFATSFSVEHFEFDGRLRSSRLLAAPQPGGARQIGFVNAQALALKHLAASADVPITEKVAHRLVRRVALHQPALVWTYVWELDRRAKGKGKGPVVHEIWRGIPWETRRALDVAGVWDARGMLLAACAEAGAEAE